MSCFSSSANFCQYGLLTKNRNLGYLSLARNVKIRLVAPSARVEASCSRLWRQQHVTVKLRPPPSRTVALTGQLDAWGRHGRVASLRLTFYITAEQFKSPSLTPPHPEGGWKSASPVGCCLMNICKNNRKCRTNHGLKRNIQCSSLNQGTNSALWVHWSLLNFIE